MADYIFLRKNGKGADIKVSRQDFANNPNAYRDYTVRMVDKDGSNWDVPFNHINDAVKDGAHVFNMKDNTPQQKSTKPAPQPKSPVAQQAVNMANKNTQPYTPSWQEQAGLMMGVDQAASMGGSDVQPMVKPGLNTDMLNQKNALANRAMAANLESNQDNLYLDELQNKANELAKQGMAEVNAKEANKSFGQKVLENLSSTTKSGYSSTPYTREVENNEKIRQANLINANIQDARKAIKDAELSQNGSWYQLLGRGLANGIDVRNFDYGITNLRNALTLRNAAREGDSNNTNSAILDSEALKNKIIAENEDKISNLITAGETTTMMVPFMVQIGSSPLKGLGSGASKWVMGKVGQEIAGNLGKRAALLALKGTTRFLGDAVEGAGTAAFFNSAGIMADALKRQRGNAVGQYGSDGYFHYSDMEGGEDNFAKAFAKAFGASAIEYQSELVGEYFSPLLKGIGKVAGKGLQKAGVLGIKQGFDTTGKKFTNVMLNLGGKKMSLDKTIGMITALSNKQYIKAFKDFSKATQWHGVIGEFAEEVVGNIENAALIGDMNWGSGENGVFNPEQNWDTFLSVAVGSGFMGMLGGVSYMGSRLAVNRGLKKYDAMGQSLFGNDSWKAIKEGFETADNPARFLASISQNLDEPSKRAIQNYAAYSMAKKGELIADMKKRMEEPQPTNVRITPYKGKFVVQSVTADGTIIESKDYDNEEDANIYKERVRTYIDNARKVQDYNNFILRDDTEKLFDQLGIDEGSRKFLEKIAYKDPLKRTDEEQEHFDNFINSIENVTYPANEVHEEREAQKGADLAEETSENIVEGAKQPNDREAAAKTRWNAVVQSQPDIDSLVGSLVSQGMTSNEIAQRLVEDYGGESEVVAAFCELCNAKANKDGYINRIGQLIQSKVEDHVDEATFAGTINGTEDKNNIYQLTDGTNIFILVGGNMTTDENGAISSDGLVVMRDNQGNFVQRENTNGLTVANVIDKEQYRQSLTTALQQQATAEIQASGNEVPEVQQPQATEPQSVIPQQEQPQPQAQEQPQEQAEEQAEAVEKEPTIPVAENGQVLYHKAPVEATINEIYAALEDEDVRQFVQNNINESSKEYDKINKKQPKIGTDINAYKQAKKDWQQQVEEAKQKLDYWNSVRDYIQKQTKTTPEEVKQTKDELSGKTAQEEYEKNKPNEAVSPVQRAGQFIRGAKIQTESFYKETGFGNAERQKFPGMVSNNGKTIDKLAEDLVAEDNSSNNGAMFHDDTMEAKNAIIEALQTAASKKELGKNTSEDFKEYERQRNEQREDFYQENFNMSYSDYLAFEEQIMPNIWRRMTNFVAEEYDRIVNESYEMRDERNNVEQINNENNGDNTEGNRQLAGGSEILPTKETAQQGGAATGSNATTETTTGSEGGNQNEEVQGGTQGVDVKNVLSKEEADYLISSMKENAEIAEEIELTPENWIALFGEDGILNTPIGQVKMGEGQYFKLAQQGRNGKLGMVKPTLENPVAIIEEERPAKNGNSERSTSYIFVKTFKKADGSRLYYFTSVTVSKDGKEVVISNQEKSENRISKLLQQSKIAWINPEFSLHPTTQIEESVPLNDSNSTTPTDNDTALLGVNSSELSASKDTTISDTNQENQQKSEEKVDEAQKTEEPQPLTEADIDADEVADDNQKALAKDFLNGVDTGIFAQVAYKNIQNRRDEKANKKKIEAAKDSKKVIVASVPKSKPKENTEKKSEEKPKAESKAPNSDVDAAKANLNDVLKRFRAAGKSDLSVSLVGLNNRQIEMLGELFQAISHVGYAYIKQGIIKADEWISKMKNEVGDAIKDATGWTDTDIDEVFTQQWNTPYLVDGVRKPLKEWAIDEMPEEETPAIETTDKKAEEKKKGLPTREELNEMTKEEMIESMWRDVFPLFCEKHRVPVDSKTGFESPYWFSPRMTKGYTKDALVESCLHYIKRLDEDVVEASEKQMKYIMSLADENEKQMFEGMKPTRTAASFLITLLQAENDAVTSKASTASDFEAYLDDIETTAKLNGGKALQSKAERKMSDRVKDMMLKAIETGVKPFRSILDIRKLGREVGLEVSDNGETDIKLQELVEDGLVKAARQIMDTETVNDIAQGKNNKFSKEMFEKIKTLYEMQPTISRRSSNRIALQQYSTPLPMAFVADMFATGAKTPLMFSTFEPTAGNGMLVFAIPSPHVHVNEIDKNRLENLRSQDFHNVTTQDATLPFTGFQQYNAIITNPPFGEAAAKDYDGYKISGLAPQIALNALDRMKDNGKAVIIIGGEQKFAPNGAIQNDKPFLAYLYNHYNVKGVIGMDGSLYAKQGTTFPTRMILIDGRRTEEERKKSDVYPPTIKDWINKASDFDRLYDTVNELLNSKEKTNGTEIVRTEDKSHQPNRGIIIPGQTDKRADSDKPVQDVATAGGGHGSDGGSGKGSKGGSPNKSGERGLFDGSGYLSDKKQDEYERGAGRPAGGDNGRGGEGVDNRQSLDDSTPGVHGTTTRGVGLNQEQEKRNLESEKLQYRPHNGAFSLESVAPAAMVEAMDKTLKRIEEEYGNIDEFVTNELGYSSLDDMHKALAAEQVDSVAMAIYNMKKGEAIVIGDQTGVGKGRQMAALIRWARRQGKKPIFMTKYDYLADDIYRDLKDIGCGEFKPFIFNDYKISEIVKDEEGKEKKKTIFKPATQKQISDALKEGKIPDDYDFVLSTYSQISTGDDISREYEAQMSKQENGDNKKRSRTRKPKPGAKPRKPTKATLLRVLAKDNYLMLDESHTAAGESNQGFYMQTLVRDSKAVTFASATYAKRPDTMPLYALRTAMSKANIGMRNLIAAIQKGGVTLQELMSRALSDSGQMVRRERDMTGVVTDWKTIDDPATVKKARDNYDKTIKAFNAIIDFQKRYIGAYLDGQRETLAVRAGNAGFVKGTENMGISNTPFANKTYNYTKQLMLALKVDAIVDEVDKQIKAGKKPVIALDNTMGSMLEDMAIGEELEETTFAASLLKGLDSIMQYSQSNGMGENVKVRISPSELGEQGELAYYNLVSFIKESTKGVFISPLDEISNKLRAKGYKVGELTGREKVVGEENGRYVVLKRGETDKAILQNKFNNGSVDVLILNKSASTGISLHASKTFADQRQRVMILAQPLPDIAEYMQMIGRIDRTGQVQRGYYINLGLPVPAEQRFLMMLSTKLKSLNANTTTSQDSKDNKVEAPDMLNKYGSIVIVEYFKDNPEIYNKMNDPLSIVKSGKSLSAYVPSFDDSDARKLTGYVALLSTDEQQAFYDDVVERYNALIKYLDDSGTNDLKITSLPLRAKTLAKAVSSEGKDPTGNNPFAQNAYVEKVEMDVLRKPMKADDIRKTINTLAEGKDPFVAVADIKNQWGDEYTAKREKENKRYEAELERNKAAVEKFAEKINANEKMPEKDKVKAINEKSTTLKNETERKHNENLTRLSNDYESLLRDFNRFSVGKTYIMPSDPNVLDFDYTSHAIFLGYKVKDKGITPSSSFAVFATLDGRRRVELKLSVRNALLNVEEITKQNYDAAQKVNLDNWDSNIPTTTRKEGYIMTGNILQAINDTQDDNGNFPGQLISYTDMEGNIRDGILMPDKWEPKMMTNAGSAISTALEQIKSGEIVISTNRDVEIHPTRSSNGNFMYYLRVPRSKKMGEKYYANRNLLKALGDKEFYEYSGTLQVSVDEDKLPDVLDVLSDMGVKVSSDIEGQLEEENATQQTNALAYNSSNNVNNSRIIPEDVDKDVSLQIENEFDSAIENLNLTEEEKTELENIIGEFSNLGTNDLEYTFYLNNSRLKIRDEKKNNLSEMLWRRGNSVSETTSSTGSNLRDEKGGTESPATANGEYSAVVSRRGEEAEGENTARGNEVQGQYNGPRDIRNAGSDRLLLHEGRRIEEKVLSKTPRTRLSSHQRRLLAAQYAISRELVYRDIRLAAIKDSLGLEAGKQTSLDDVAKIFEKYNKDKEVKALFDKILAINKRLGTSVEILASDENGNYGSAGTKRDVRYYLDGFTRTSSNQSVNIPLVIAHELLHQGTVGAINLVKKGKAEGVLTKEQIDAVNTILDIYNKVKANEGILSESKRGLANPYEFAAQMVDPRQRKALAMSPLQRVIAAANELKAQGNTSLWERIKNALKTLFGLSDLKKMDNAINTLLDTFNETIHDISMADVDQNGWGYKVEDKTTLDKLNSEPTIKVYRAMQVIDGKLYPPMAAKVNGSLVEPTKIGEWYQADEHPELIIPDGTYKDGTPKYKFKLDKGGNDATGKKATDIAAAYNPYWHTSRSPINDQFKSAWIRPNLVTVEVEVPESELTSGYKAQYAKDAVGEVEWKSGSVSGQLAKQGNPRKVILSRYNRLVRVVPVEEVADRFKGMLDGTGIEVPENTVTPQLRAALEAKGVKIGKPEKGVNKNAQIEQALNKGLEVDNTLYRRQENQPTSPSARRVSDESQSQILAHAQAVAEKLNTKLTFTTSDQLTGEKAAAKGFYDTKTGKVTIVIDNNTDKLDVEKTILHEVVGHKGMRGLLGNVGYRKLLDAVYDSLSEEQKKDIKEKAMRNGYKFYQAMDEYFAEQAENMAWDSKSASMWDNIKHYVTEAIRKLGFIIRPNYRDIRYWLWLSKNQLQTDNPMSEIKRQAFLYKLGRLGAPKFDDYFNLAEGRIDYTDVDTAFRNGDIKSGTTGIILDIKKDNYWTRLKNSVKEAYYDHANSLKEFQKDIEPYIQGGLMDNQNAYLGENQRTSNTNDAQEMFRRNEITKLQIVLHAITPLFNGASAKEKLEDLKRYLIKKHGLERNRVLFFRDWYRNNLKKKIEKPEDLPTEAYEIYEKKVIGIETDFEDGLINEKQEDKALQNAAQEAWLDYLDKANNDFGKLHNRLAKQVDNKSITLAEMYSQLDAYINQYEEYDPNGFDYSGLTAFAVENGEELDDAKIIEEVMAIEDSINRNDNEILGKLQDAIHAITQKGLDEDLRSGIISKSAYDRASSMFRWYIPLRGFDKDVMEDFFKYDYANDVAIGSVLKKAKGRHTLAFDPIATAINMTANSFSRGEKNLNKQRAYRAVTHYLKGHGTKGAIASVSDVWYKLNETTGEYEIATPPINDKMSADDMRNTMDAWTEKMKDLEHEGKTKRKKMKGDFIAPFSNGRNKNANIVFLKINGEQKMIIFHGDPRPARVLNGEMAPEHWPYWDDLTRFMSSLATTYNPTFVGANLMRDVLFSNNNIMIKENASYYGRFTKNQSKILGSMLSIRNIANLAIKNVSVKPNSYVVMYERYKKGIAPETQEEIYFKEFMENGGRTGITQQFDIDRIERMIKLATTPEGVMKYVKWPLEHLGSFVEALNERVENANRFCAYMTSRQEGRSVMRSISDAKEVTVNFNRKGASWKTAKYGNTYTEKFVGASAAFFKHGFMFFNAGIQGFSILWNNLDKHTIKTISSMMLPPFLLSFMLPYLNEFLISVLGGDDDDYANLSPWKRRNNLCIYAGNHRFVTIPLPIEHRAFFGLGDIAYSTINNKYSTGQEPWGEAMMQIADIFPVDYSKAFVSSESGVVDLLMPDLIKPIWQIHNNRDWTGSMLHKEEAFYNKYDPKYELAFDNENQIAVGIAKMLNKWTAVDKYGLTQGKINIHPSTIRYAVEQYLGGAGKDALNIMDLGIGAVKGEFRVNSVPFVRGLFQVPDDRNKYTRIKLKYNNYRSEADEYEAKLKTFMKASKSGDKEQADYYKGLAEEWKRTKDYRIMVEVNDFIRNKEKRFNKKMDNPSLSDTDKKTLQEVFMADKKDLIERIEAIENQY